MSESGCVLSHVKKASKSLIYYNNHPFWHLLLITSPSTIRETENVLLSFLLTTKKFLLTSPPNVTPSNFYSLVQILAFEVIQMPRQLGHPHLMFCILILFRAKSNYYDLVMCIGQGGCLGHLWGIGCLEGSMSHVILKPSHPFLETAAVDPITPRAKNT